MKRPIFYIAMFLVGIIIGAFIFEAYGDKKYEPLKVDMKLLALNSPPEERPTDYIQSVAGQIGNTLFFIGVVKEVYKNKENEVVIYLKDKDIPLLLNCTLSQSDIQIKRAMKLGETIGIKGKFTEIGDEMYLENCKIVNRIAE